MTDSSFRAAGIDDFSRFLFICKFIWIEIPNLNLTRKPRDRSTGQKNRDKVGPGSDTQPVLF